MDLFYRKKLIVLITLILTFFINTTQAAVDNISYKEVGYGEPLVLIHAFPTDQQLWLPQQNGLAQYFRVITLDLWGFGQSKATDGRPVTMTDYADEVKELLDQLHIKKAIIGGESMGGYVALAFLQKYPDTVNGLVLSSTQSIADTQETKTKREATAIDVLEHGTVPLINNFMPKALSPNASEQTKIFLKNILAAQAATGIASALRGMAKREDTSHILANSSLPILIMTGDQDTVIAPQQSKNMHALAKNSRLVMLSNAGHLANLEQPEQWNQAVIDMFHKSK
ncbi:MAG: alpha/beta fold hydrolase [Gammaproteobacteria bacterium]